MLLAGTHSAAKEHLELLKLFSSHGWNGTASAAQPTERSEYGTSAGLTVTMRNYHSNRPVGICSDVKGKATPNAFLTGRLLVLQNVDLLWVYGRRQPPI